MEQQVDPIINEKEQEMNEQPQAKATWFQIQINEVAKELSESAVNQLAIKIPTLDMRLLQYFKQERAVQISASLLTNRMLQYILESLHGLYTMALTSQGFKDANESAYKFHSLASGEDEKISLKNMLSEDEQDQIKNEILNVLQMELSQIMEQAKAQQAQMQQAQSGIQQNSGGNIIF